MEFLSHYLSSLRKRKGEGGRWLSPMNEIYNVVTQRRSIRIAPLSLSVVFAWSAPDAGVESLSANNGCLFSSTAAAAARPDPWFWLYWSQLVGSKNSRRGRGVALPGTTADFLSSFSPGGGGGMPRECCCCIARKRGILACAEITS